MKHTLREFLRLETASSILLLIAAVLAMIVVNSPLSGVYNRLLELPLSVQVGSLQIAKPLLLWINDGLMALFFLVVGLELKREVLEGELSSPAQVVLPAVGAIGGMAIPALIYVVFNWGDSTALNGWAIPAATDIAFALGLLAAFGSRVPTALKLFLLTLAIFDDVGAIVIIALFYSSNLSVAALIVAALMLMVLGLLNWRGVTSISAYMMIGVVLWVAVLKSGVHATLAGVLLALFIPLRVPGPDKPPLKRLEHDLHTAVAFGILPLFAFTNAGISFTGVSLDTLLRPIPLGIALGLVVGKQIGVMSLTWIAARLGIARLPQGVTWLQLYGVSMVCGIGFTMSLFIGSLAFEQGGPDYSVPVRLGIVVGSVLAALGGYLVLRVALPRDVEPEQAPT